MLSGYKSYILAALAVLVAGLCGLGYIPVQTAIAWLGVLLGGGVAGARYAAAKG